jgi:hypothetical protein
MMSMVKKILTAIFICIIISPILKTHAQANEAAVDEKTNYPAPSLTQTDSLQNHSGKSDNGLSNLKVSGYIETYYSYDFSNPDNHTRPSFVYAFNRHNEINVNIGLIKLSYADEKVRANMALMAGTYANANLAAEPGVLSNIFEANAGLKISAKKNIWIDAGVFGSHIGFESAIGKDCWNLTRSILADNSPYYETGAKISYTSNNEKWFLSGLILNGWQRIQRLYGNNTPAFGHQLTFKPNSAVTLNSSSFIGSDTPDSIRQMRYFHNLYGIFQLNKTLGLIVGFDIGAQQKSKGSRQYHCWYSPVVIGRFSPPGKWSFSARAEYYSDENEVIIVTGTPNGFQTFGYSLNADLNITNKLVWRLEGRGLSSKDEIFTLQNKPDTKNYFVTTSLAFAF